MMYLFVIIASFFLAGITLAQQSAPSPEALRLTLQAQREAQANHAAELNARLIDAIQQREADQKTIADLRAKCGKPCESPPAPSK